MNILDRTLPWLPRIDLAREPDFSVGQLRVHPSRREVEFGGDRLLLQRRVMQVLVALAHPSSEVVSQDELISRCWGGLAVGEDAVARCIGQLRRLAASWPDPPFQIETIAGVGYRLSATSAPAPDAPPPGPPSRRGQGAWIALTGVAAVGALAVVALTALHPWRQSRVASSAPMPTIAVLGFQPAAAGDPAKTLAAALPRRVADALSQYDVTVVGPSAGAPAAADFVVEGRVTDKDGRLHVIADLSDPHSHVLVYSFDTVLPADPKGDVAGEIATHVALSLDPTKLSNALSGQLTPVDYTLIARANDGIGRWDMPYVLDLTQKLAVRHPRDGDLRASAAIAAIYAAQMAAPSQQAQLLQLGRRAIGEAERLPPKSGMLYVAKSMLVNGPMAYAEQERLLRKAMSLTPGFHVTYNGLGYVLLTVGRMNEGAALTQRSVQLDPMSSVVVNGAVGNLVVAGHADEARAMLDREEQIWPGDWRTIASEFYVAVYQGAPQQVLDFQRRNVPPKGSTAERINASLDVDAWLTRDPRSIRRMVSRCFSDVDKPPRPDLGELTPQLEAPDCLIQMVRLGAMDDAFRFAALAYPDDRTLHPVDADEWLTRGWLDPSWLFLPTMKPFRDDPRFWDVAVRTGLVNYWQSTGSWPDFCQPQLDNCKRLAATAALARPLPQMRR